MKKRKPVFDKAAGVRELIEAVGEYYEQGENVSLRETAEHFGMTMIKVRKLLITSGKYSSGLSVKVQELAAEGRSMQEIGEYLGLKKSSVNSYLPYKNVVYKLPEVSLEAERQKQYRVRRRNTKRTEEERAAALWKELIYLQGCLFRTRKGLDFTYQIQGGEMFISRKEKSITYATVMEAYFRAKELGFTVKGPKQLGTFGASYLYPVFLKMGIIQE